MVWIQNVQFLLGKEIYTMKLFAIQKPPPNTYAPQFKQNSSVNQNPVMKTNLSGDKFISKVSFGAKRLPSGEYSNWFVDLVRKNLRNASEAMRKHIADFREEETEAFVFGRFFAGKKIDRNVMTRENDYLKVAADLKDKHKPVNIGLKHYEHGGDYSVDGWYSSPKDWENRNYRVEAERRAEEEWNKLSDSEKKEREFQDWKFWNWD